VNKMDGGEGGSLGVELVSRRACPFGTRLQHDLLDTLLCYDLCTLAERERLGHKLYDGREQRRGKDLFALS
jgi:hypothetical protein